MLTHLATLFCQNVNYILGGTGAYLDMVREALACRCTNYFFPAAEGRSQLVFAMKVPHPSPACVTAATASRWHVHTIWQVAEQDTLADLTGLIAVPAIITVRELFGVHHNTLSSAVRVQVQACAAPGSASSHHHHHHHWFPIVWHRASPRRLSTCPCCGSSSCAWPLRGHSGE